MIMTKAHRDFYDKLASRLAALAGTAKLLGSGNVPDPHKTQKAVLNGMAHLTDQMGLDDEVAKWKAAAVVAESIPLTLPPAQPVHAAVV